MVFKRKWIDHILFLLAFGTRKPQVTFSKSNKVNSPLFVGVSLIALEKKSPIWFPLCLFYAGCLSAE